MCENSYYEYLNYIEGRCMNDSEDCSYPEEADDDETER